MVVGMKLTDRLRALRRGARTRRLVTREPRTLRRVRGIGDRRGWLAAAMLFSLFSATIGHAAQQQPAVTERVDVSRVLIDVRVIGDGGEPVAGLGPHDFEVRIGGEPVDVESALWLGADGSGWASLPSDEVEVWTGGEPG